MIRKKTFFAFLEEEEEEEEERRQQQQQKTCYTHRSAALLLHLPLTFSNLNHYFPHAGARPRQPRLCRPASQVPSCWLNGS